MRIFITYAREDGATVTQLGADLERNQRQVWIDRELTGGQVWWEEILKQIRECDLYVFAVSPSSLRSRPCLRELEYAQALGRPLLAVKVEEVSIQQAPRVIVDSQVVDYVGRTPDGVLALRDALDAAPSPPALPDPLPEPPAVPISYLGQYREQVGAESLTFGEQQALLLELKNYMGNEDDRDDAVDLLGALRRRHDLAQSVATEIDTVLAPVQTQQPAAPQSTPVEVPIAASTPPASSPPVSPTTPPKKRTGLFVGIGLAVVALLLVVLAQVISESSSETPPSTFPPSPITTIPEVLGCPFLAAGFPLPLPETPYGPFGAGYSILWHQPGGFAVYYPNSAVPTEYADVARDTWIALTGTPFQVCVDTAGNVFAVVVG